MITRYRSGFTLMEVLAATAVAVVTVSLIAAAVGNAAAGSLKAARCLRAAVALREFESLVGVGGRGIPERFDAAGLSWKVSTVEDDPRAAWILVEAGAEDQSFRVSVPREFALHPAA
ncbi:MAG TPA: hypothetical protein EYP62_07270 [Kiritimatiellae bacterium]|nr:hypothetical protein [Kiritimatiellia bacterium]